MRVADQAQFHRLAEYYDALNEFKDYRQESRRLEGIARRFSLGRPRTWLDVACGTGRHLEFLNRRYDATGIDASEEMLRIAHRRLPGVPLLRGDMRTFALDRKFDVVSCLFSAIGHLRTERDVRVSFANFSRHLNPGGVAMVEPWIGPATFRPGYVDLRTYEGPKVKLARLTFSDKRANRSIVRYHFLIGEQGKGIRHFEEREVGLLLSRVELLEMMNAAGLRSRFLSSGLSSGRGLLVGVKPGPD
jgi:ubiquinone/menaquinone biosynthesis C-methylase UbiE